jgi:hypothetical protein
MMCGAVDQADAEMILELAQRPRHDGLGQVQAGGGAGERAFLGDRQETAEVTQLHGHAP